MKKIKRLIVAILALVMLLSCAMFAGCEKKDECNHDNVIVCAKCGKVALGDEFFVNTVKSNLASTGVGKGYKTEFSGSVLLTDAMGLEVGYDDGNDDVSKPIEKIEASITDSQITMYFDQDANPYLDGELKLIANAYCDGVIFCTTTVELADVKLENYTFSFNMKQSTTYPTLSEDLQELNNSERNIPNEINLLEGMGEEAGMITGILPMVLDCYEDVLLPYANGILDANKTDVNTAVAKAFDSLFSVKKVDSGYEFNMDKLGTAMKGLNALLDTKISKIVDDEFGAGTYDKIPETIEKLLDKKISDVLTYLEGKGITFAGLLETGNKLAQKILGDEEVTLEDLLGMEQGSIEGYFNALDKEQTIRQLLKNVAGVKDEDIAEMITEVTEWLSANKEKSLFDIMEIDAETKTMITEGVNVLAAFIDEVLSVKIATDGSGNMLSQTYAINYDPDKDGVKGLLTWIESMMVGPSNPDALALSETEAVPSVASVISSAKINLVIKSTLCVAPAK